ncbi:phage tail sheath family protein [Pantoea agglomerans]|uniref:phage tail sheath family protein n=1 Tax=Enterobacter agglomerans TaxID=549 RepID=UPI0007E5AFA3
MSQGYHHGMRVEEINEGTRTITTVSTAIVVLICTGGGGDDAATFPLNRTVLLTDILTFSGRGGYRELQTDQAIREISMSREVKADTEKRHLVGRETTVKVTDRTTVIGTVSLMAGAIQHVTTGNYSMATQQSQLITVGGNAETDVTVSVTINIGQALTEKIGQLRQSIAGAPQEIIAPVVWIGSEKINVAQLMLDTVALVQQLADQLASHMHPSTGQPTNSAALAQSGVKALELAKKYSHIIG